MPGIKPRAAGCGARTLTIQLCYATPLTNRLFNNVFWSALTTSVCLLRQEHKVYPPVSQIATALGKPIVLVT